MRGRIPYMVIAGTEAQPTRETLPKLLLVDDDALIVDALSLSLGDRYDVVTAGDRGTALQRMRGAAPPVLALLDLGLPPAPHSPAEGLALLSELLAADPRMKIIVMSGQGGRAAVREALALGAADFIPKPCDLELLLSRLGQQRAMQKTEQAAGPPGGDTTSMLVGQSRAIGELRECIGRYADSPHPVLVEGESGTGKELVAHCLHLESNRAAGPYLKLNCAALPAELLEAELFGHARGAFTGAVEQRRGFLEAAGGGSLLLDEVGELPLPLQAKLLRVLDDGEYFRVGETTPRRFAGRILAGTNRALQDEVRDGRFRRDLYHRLAVLSIRVPPLRERSADVLLLYDHFVRCYGESAGLELRHGSRELLLAYPFPGNVRELRNVVIRLGARGLRDGVGVADLERELEPPVGEAETSEDAAREHLRRAILDGGFDLKAALDKHARLCIHLAMELADGNLSRAARLLGMHRTTLYDRLRRLSGRE